MPSSDQTHPTRPWLGGLSLGAAVLFVATYLLNGQRWHPALSVLFLVWLAILAWIDLSASWDHKNAGTVLRALFYLLSAGAMLFAM